MPSRRRREAREPRISRKRQTRRKRRASHGSRRRPRLRSVLKALVFVLVGAALAVPAVFVNTVIGYAPVLFYVLLLVGSYVYCRITARAVSFDLMSSKSVCPRGESVEFKLRVGNRSPLFLYGVRARFTVHDLFGNEATGEDVSLNVASHDIHDFGFDLGLPHVGEFDAGVDSVTVGDPLGLFERKLAVESRHHVVVSPRLHDVEGVNFATANLLESSESIRSSRSDGGDYTSVREYEQGDPLKSIHWKLSAHSNGYLTKLFENYSEPRLDVYLSFAAPEGLDDEALMELNDIAIESALSLASYAHERGLESSVAYLDKDGETQRVHAGRELDARAMIRQLPLMGAQDDAVFLDEFRTRASSLHAADNIILCSAVFDENVAASLSRVHMTGRNVSLFALLPHALDSEQRSKALRRLGAFDAMNVSCHVADDETDVLR